MTSALWSAGGVLRRECGADRETEVRDLCERFFATGACEQLPLSFLAMSVFPFRGLIA
jgi:hypothetical protein